MLKESRIEFFYKSRNDKILAQKIFDYFGYSVKFIKFSEVLRFYSHLSEEELRGLMISIQNPVEQEVYLGYKREREFDWFLQVQYLPGVTDNIARTTRDLVRDVIGRKLSEEEQVFSSQEYFISSGDIKDARQVRSIAEELLANKLLQSINVKSFSDWKSQGNKSSLPLVVGEKKVVVKHFRLADYSDKELMNLSKERSLALSLDEMKSIQNYSLKQDIERKSLGLSGLLTDGELECLAQTWSEHCKHKIFAADIEYTDENGETTLIKSLYKSFIQRSTEEISQEVDWLVSVFKDNAGVIKFNEEFHLVYKVETHNSPSALDPYGGAMTGIVGVNRDPMGTGMGAKLLINVWGYCFAPPETSYELVPKGFLHPSRIRDGVHQGVIDGGNQSGIPYGLGWEYFDNRYLAKPLVFCGTVGLLPKKIGDILGEEKEILSGDLIVMVGGRVGKDGIHGATFSSEELHSSSPVQAVQIGDPITQKKVYDFTQEARDLGLYRFITDNGAGGLSSSIGEMAENCRGCFMDLAKVPLKYFGLNPWEILISEAQERMSYAVIPEKLDEFLSLAQKREVEASVLGEFTNSGKFHVVYEKKIVCYLDIDFMHKLPPMKLRARWIPPIIKDTYQEQDFVEEDLFNLLSSLNIKSYEEKARQYDHEVKALSVVKPFIGVNNDVCSDATVFMSSPCSKEGIVLACGLAPHYSDIDTYHMVGSIIDMAVRKTLSVGGRLDHIAGIDNFCWADPIESEKTPDGQYKLAQLVRANQALYDYCKAFKVPCISGKDSMKNDSILGGKKISIPPTVLFSTIAKIDDVSQSTHFANFCKGEEIFIVGVTKNELGGSQYSLIKKFQSPNVPKVDASLSYKTYEVIAYAKKQGLIQALGAPSLGGLAFIFAKMFMANPCGLSINLDAIPCEEKLSFSQILFSETSSRFVLSVKREQKNSLVRLFEGAGLCFACIGDITDGKTLNIFNNEKVFTFPFEKLVIAYNN